MIAAASCGRAWPNLADFVPNPKSLASAKTEQRIANFEALVAATNKQHTAAVEEGLKIIDSMVVKALPLFAIVLGWVIGQQAGESISAVK